MSAVIDDKLKGATILIRWDDITYAGQSPTSLTGLSFKLTIAHVRTGQEVVSLTDADEELTAVASDGAVNVSATINTTGDEWVPGQQYKAELWAIDAALGNHPLDVFRIVLNPSITELETEE